MVSGFVFFDCLTDKNILSFYLYSLVIKKFLFYKGFCYYHYSLSGYYANLSTVWGLDLLLEGDKIKIEKKEYKTLLQFVNLDIILQLFNNNLTKLHIGFVDLYTLKHFCNSYD